MRTRSERRMTLRDKTIAIIGSGNMGEALIRGLLATGVVAPHQIIATDLHAERREHIERKLGVAAVADNSVAVEPADIVVLAVKPQQMSEALSSFRHEMSAQKVIITIAAGITTTRIEQEMEGEPRVVRVMPNTPAQVCEGAAALCKGRYATDDDLVIAEAVLGAVGVTVRTDESMLDAVTALSGTGPAYVFLVAETMIKAGVELGLSHELSKTLAVQTVLGAARLMMANGEEPEALRHRVTSRGGTTEAALKVMGEGKLVEVFTQAIKAAARRSGELSGS